MATEQTQPAATGPSGSATKRRVIQWLARRSVVVRASLRRRLRANRRGATRMFTTAVRSTRRALGLARRSWRHLIQGVRNLSVRLSNSPFADPARVVRILGLAAMAAGILALADPVGWPHIAVAGGLIALLGPGLLFPASRRLERRTGSERHAPDYPYAANETSNASGYAASEWDDDFESLKDMQWELRDNETRYRDLLDSQTDIILRQRNDGPLIFVNRAFCRTFDVEPRDVIGKSFTPSVVQSDLEQEQTDDDRATGSRRRRFVQEIETARGPRWFSWEEQSVRNSEDGAVETQRIGRDITEQRQIEKTLDEARRQAEAASEAKSRFLAVMSHEIRTPLGGIMGMTGLLEGTKLTAEQRTYATAVKDSAKSLLTIIDEILDFSKIEAGKVKLDHEPFQLDHLIQGVAELLGPRAWEKNLELAWDIDPSLPASVIGDEHRIRQILMNLLGNAIKFTSDGGVRLSVTAGENSGPKNSIAGQTMIRFAVTDTGIGLTDEQRERIFTEFEQADTTTTRRFGGTGLGLTISRRLARSMDGDITIISHRPTFDGATDEDTSGTSRASERGTTFALTLPLATSANATTLDETWARSRTPSVVTCATTGRNVLIASSRTIEAAAMSQTLIASGHNVLRADPDEAIACIKAASLSAAPIDTVISDTSVDTELRLKICTRAQEHVDEQADYLALIVIESADRDQLSDLRDEGFAAYLMRPVRPASLLSQLAQSRSHGKSDCTHPTPQPKLTVMNSVEPPPPTSDDLIEPPASNARVLLAEDNPINALLAKRILEDMSLEVVHVENGIEALNAVRQCVAGVAPAFDLVLMDLHMPEMDGIAACKEIRTLSGSPIPPIIALTANAFPEDRQRCLKAGMCDYLTKPFEREQLAAMIDQWCHGVEPEDRHGSLMELASIPIGW